ncbi:Uncharacterised protein [Mycobacteroides abscessus subsp. massiliense]|nr:Uncharacterised protein [Mycobacteroides abscessus subsp. massiliense]
MGNRVHGARATTLSTEDGGDIMANYAMKRPRLAKRLSRVMGFEVDGSVDDTHRLVVHSWRLSGRAQHVPVHSAVNWIVTDSEDIDR